MRSEKKKKKSGERETEQKGLGFCPPTVLLSLSSSFRRAAGAKPGEDLLRAHPDFYSAQSLVITMHEIMPGAKITIKGPETWGEKPFIERSPKVLETYSSSIGVEEYFKTVLSNNDEITWKVHN